MSVYDHLNFGNIVSFDVYPATIIGARFKDVKVLGVFDKDTAAVLGIDPDAQHINVYPTLPDGVPDDPGEYEYVKVKHPNGSTSVLGVPWIREDTIMVSQRGTLTIVIADVTPQDKDRIVTAINANGYRVDKLSLK